MVVRAMRMFETPNLVDRWPVSVISTCLLLLHLIVKPKTEIKYRNKIYVIDVIKVIGLVLAGVQNSMFSCGCSSTQSQTVATGFTTWKTWTICIGAVLPP
jgi:hypothetical protein